MNLLAIETATEACSVALLSGGAVLERHEIAPRRHAELLLPMIDALLSEAGVSRRALDAIAVGRGPGAFTGVRLAISAAQGIALALDRPVATVSTLAALALGAIGVGSPVPPRTESASPTCLAKEFEPPHVLALIDARMGEVYAGAFARDDHGLVTALDEERLSRPEALVLSAAAAWIVAGTGWGAYADVLRTRLGGELQRADGEALPHACAIAHLGAREVAQGRGVDAAHAQPVYLRDKVALTLAEQQAR